jgi:hypothetical protein
MLIEGVKVFIFSCFCFFLFNLSLKGIISIDFGESQKKHTTRVIAYNVATQDLLFYEEINSHLPWKKNIDSYSLNYNAGGRVSINSTNLPPTSPLFVRSQGQIQSSIKGYSYCDFKIWSSYSIEEKSPQDIKSFLPFSPIYLKKDRPSLPILRHYNPLRAETLESLSSDDKGKLGELVTTMTFLSFGYEQLPSKYKGNCGLDGIFKSLSNNYLFLTQSKQKNKSQTAENVVQHELNEPKISSTLLEMEMYPESVYAASVLREFLAAKPNCVYKFGHRVADTGKIQYYLAPLTIGEFPKSNVKLTGALETQKIKAVQDTLVAFENTPEKQLELALKALLPHGFLPQKVNEMFIRVYEESQLPLSMPLVGQAITLTSLPSIFNADAKAAVPPIVSTLAPIQRQPATPIVSIYAPIQRQPATPIVPTPAPVQRQPATPIVSTPAPVQRQSVPPIAPTPAPVHRQSVIPTSFSPPSKQILGQLPTIPSQQEESFILITERLPTAPFIEYSEKNYQLLLQNLKTQVGPQEIAQMAGYQCPSNALRDYRNLPFLNDDKKKEKWNILLKSLYKKKLSLQQLLNL